MEKSIRNFNFLVLAGPVLGLVVSATFIPTVSAQKAPGANPIMKAGSELVAGDRKLEDPLRVYQQTENLKWAETAKIKETEGCKYLQSWEPSFITKNHWNSSIPAFARRRVRPVLLAIPAKTNCIKIGVPARVASVDRATGLAMDLGWFMPTGIAPRRPELAKQEEAVLVSAGLIGSDAEIVMVTGQSINSVGPVGPGNYAPRMVGVRMIDRDQMEAAIKDGTQIVDVRSKKQFDLVRVKGAVHVPYTPGPRMKIFDEYANYVKSGDAFDIRRVNPDREKPIILIGEGWESDGVYRAAIVLRSEGWKKIFIFYEGMNYFTGMQWSPPLTSGLAGAPVSANQVADLLLDRSSGLQVIDVREAKEFNVVRLPGAKLAPYRERDDLKLRRTAGLNGKILTDYGDVWAAPPGLDKTKPILIIDQSPYDWRAYKAALVAKSQGFSKIYWSYSGVEAWALLAQAVPERFPVVRGAAK